MRAPGALLIGLLSGLAAAPVAAHPHIFIDAGLGFLFDDQGRLAAVRVEWVYDPYYTLVLLADLGLDADGDLVLTEDELARLLAADSDWAPDYEGDLYASVDGRPLAFAQPLRFGVAMEDGRIVSTHIRPLAEPVALGPAGAEFRTYDPWYYAAFDLSRPVLLAGNDACAVQVIPADEEAARRVLERQLQEAAARGDVEGAFPAVGAEFADLAVIACAP